jgi:hypothetical protein
MFQTVQIRPRIFVLAAAQVPLIKALRDKETGNDSSFVDHIDHSIASWVIPRIGRPSNRLNNLQATSVDSLRSIVDPRSRCSLRNSHKDTPPHRRRHLL